ncbi:MAG: hypothetical protein OXG94_12300 [Bacteroidetes bacterium]|nr:hypothetical protein [Bacteroidota bacterium]
MNHHCKGICLVLLLVTGCAPREVLVLEPPPPTPTIPAVPGVDSVFAAMAQTFARRGHLVDARASETSRRAVEGGKRLFALADSLSARLAPSADSVLVSDEAVAESIRRFNAGAQVLDQPNMGTAELAAAAEQFNVALDSNPYDAEALYWLSRVYELQSERFMETGATEQNIDVLSRLTEMYPLRHDYAGLLASAFEGLDAISGWSQAGAWWHRASVLVRDEPSLSLDSNTQLDTASTFIYLANASRAFIEANEGNLALAAILEAAPFAVNEEERDYLTSEKEWLTWDATLVTRKRFDVLLQESLNNPAGAVTGFRSLIAEVTLPQAEVDVRHQLALALFNAGNPVMGITEIQQAWKDVAQMDSTIQGRIREDYGTMAYSLAIEHREAGELRTALAYLLQSEATKFSGAPLSALTRSILLRSDPNAALDAAKLAEAGWDQLDAGSQRTLLEHMVSLYRRLNNRDQAVRYAQRYRELTANN